MSYRVFSVVYLEFEFERNPWKRPSHRRPAKFMLRFRRHTRRQAHSAAAICLMISHTQSQSFKEEMILSIRFFRVFCSRRLLARTIRFLSYGPSFFISNGSPPPFVCVCVVALGNRVTIIVCVCGGDKRRRRRRRL